MPDKLLPNGPLLTRKKHTLALKAECVCQVAARLTNSNATSKLTHLSPLSVFTGPSHTLYVPSGMNNNGVYFTFEGNRIRRITELELPD